MSLEQLFNIKKIESVHRVEYKTQVQLNLNGKYEFTDEQLNNLGDTAINGYIDYNCIWQNGYDIRTDIVKLPSDIPFATGVCIMNGIDIKSVIESLKQLVGELESRQTTPEPETTENKEGATQNV